MSKIKVTNMNKALDKYYGEYGHTCATKEGARADLKARGYTLIKGQWTKYGKPAFMYPLFTTDGNLKKKPDGFLVTYGATNIGFEDCMLQEIPSKAKSKDGDLKVDYDQESYA